MLSVKDLSFGYGDKKILDGISFDAEGNSVVSILGPNGVGKTTLLKCLCKMHAPDSGTIELNGKDVLSMSGREAAKHIGFVPQSTPPSGTSVFDAALIGRRPHIEWAMGKEDMRITWEALRALKIDGLALKRTDEISGGEYQKVQIARAMVQQPEVLILDEPTNNLDIANQHIAMRTISEAVSSRGMCTIMTMHDINLAAGYSDRFLFIKNGKVAAYGGTDIITSDLVKDVYGIEADVIMHKGKPFVIPDLDSERKRFHAPSLSRICVPSFINRQQSHIPKDSLQAHVFHQQNREDQTRRWTH
ncbi:MAG: ABC transporter ATP-binding protein [Candidatus Methanomethylophilaceae archaeon]|jgi:iron complex transport system ATP-binding protein|nr:ABC transporter ATP-binding protein [Candidatus Methanomethylophilaceae archaeon]